MPQSNVQHAVPQNIMDVEFKLIGDLTMRQFSYLLIFGLLAYFSTNIPGLFKWPTVFFFAILALGLAFVPVQERGLDEWLVNFYRAITSPTQRVWRKEPQIPTAFLYDSLAMVQHEMITLAPTSSRRKLEDYLKNTLEEGIEDPLDIPIKDYVKKVREAYQGYGKAPSVGVSLEPPIVGYEPGKKAPESRGEKISFSDVSPEEQVVGEAKASEKISGTVHGPAINVSESEVSPPVYPSQATAFSGEIGVERVPASVVKADSVSEVPKVSEKEEGAIDVAEEPVIKKARSVYDRGFYSGLKKEAGVEDGELFTNVANRLDMESYEIITPDMHSGRKFVNLVPSGGEIVLPIRGERVLKTSEDISLDKDIEEKAKQLEELLDKIRTEEGIVPEKARPAEKKVAKIEPVEQVEKHFQETSTVGGEAEDVVAKLKKQNEELATEIKKLKEQIERSKSLSIDTDTQERLLRKLEYQKGDFASSYAELKKQIRDLQKKLDEKVIVSTGKDFVDKLKRQLPVLTNTPNIISGVVRDSSGNQLSDMLILVKNSRGDTVRALKTNSLGQFVVSTPLQNGTYTVEVSPSNKTDLTFAIIPVEVRGGIIPTLDIVGK